MQVYLVGGAVRDRLLGLPVMEQDWVVVGATAETLLAKGYRSVGNNFPVFLHPVTQQEYALARTERKIGPGHKGFNCFADPSVTLEQDLYRRDLTINAIALDAAGTIIDPFDGRGDLAARILRHISPAFTEDPLRVLRVARFAARFANLGFTIAAETQTLMQHMVTQGELAYLTTERVWQETQRALATTQPSIFFEVLKKCGALGIIFGELSAYYSPYMLQSLANATELSPCPMIRWASFLQLMPAQVVNDCCKKLHVSSYYADLALLAANHQLAFQQVQQANSESILDLLQTTDALRRPQRFNDLLTVWRSHALFSAREQSAHFLLQAQRSAMNIDMDSILKPGGLSGLELKNNITAARLQAIDKLR